MYGRAEQTMDSKIPGPSSHRMIQPAAYPEVGIVGHVDEPNDGRRRQLRKKTKTNSAWDELNGSV